MGSITSREAEGKAEKAVKEETQLVETESPKTRKRESGDRSASRSAKRQRTDPDHKGAANRGHQNANKRFSKGFATAPRNGVKKEEGKTEEMVEESEQDLRGGLLEDVRIKAENLIRVKRGKDGSLSLDLNGQPLYSANVLDDYSKTHNALTTAPSPSGTGKDLKVERPNRMPNQSLTWELRKQLRKRTYKFTRCDENLGLFDSKLFTTGELTGAFGIPEKRKITLRNKLYLAPLTTVGNLPFRRLCKTQGADITCGEMAVAENILKGRGSEWALLRRHESEDSFGIQLAGSNVDVMARASELIGRSCSVDFVELNAGCPIDLIFQRGGGCALMTRRQKFCRLVWSVSRVVDMPVGVKMRTGVSANSPVAHTLIPDLARAGAQWVTVHGRSRKQRYSRLADWDYIRNACGRAARASGVSLLGNGDVYNWRDARPYLEGGQCDGGDVTSVMIARGALIKPWIFTEIKERRDWDIRSSERLDLYKQFVAYGMEHWGSDERGVETTRRFLLEWLSFLYRYVPVGIVDGGRDYVVRMSNRAPYFRGRDDLETLLASPQSADWIRISEMLLGKVSSGFHFEPRHKSNAWDGGGGGGRGDDATATCAVKEEENG